MGLKAQNVGVSYRAPVLRDVCAEFEPGAVSVILGPNGCGKTTLLRLLLGLLKPHTGVCSLDETTLDGLSAADRAARLAYVPHRPAVEYSYSVREFVSFAHASSVRKQGAIEAAIDRLRLGELADRPMGKLSAGQAQRASIARALAQLSDPTGPSKFFVADEPTSALDPRHAVEVTQTLRSLASEGFGVVVVVHDLSVAARLADRVVLMSSEGRVHAAGGPEEVLTPEQLEPIFSTRFGVVEHEGRRVPVASPESVAGPR